MHLGHHDADVYRARRLRLAEHLDALPALIPAGAAPARNYLAARYPFRASSHFLYLIGLPLEAAFALCDGDQCTLFVEPRGADDALWHGPEPDLEQLAEPCAVRPLASLSDQIAGRPVATLPAPDPITRARQAALLGREVTHDRFADDDARLADAMIALRLVHDGPAIEGLRRAANATVAAHRAGMAATRPGILEATVRAAMESVFVSMNMTTSYNSIVTVHGEVLHNESYHRTLGRADLLLADVGAEAQDGWAGDVTRTWPVSGRFSSTQRELYEVVLAAQSGAIELVRPGVRYRDVHVRACHALAAGLVDLGILHGDPEELVADGVHALLFPHGIGHLLGLDVHDMEDLGDRAGYGPGRTRAEQFGLAALRLDRDLAPGMAVTIEPGLYIVPAILEREDLRRLAGDRLDRDRLAQFGDVRGIRIEDDVLVTERGSEVLTGAAPKAPEELQAQVGTNA